MQGRLQYLGVARCDLIQLPSYLSEFMKLEYLDARDNNISTVNKDLKILLKTNEAESYFSGNVVCNVDKELDCEPVCTKYCWSRHASNNGFCDDQCNSKECEYDGGDCA